MYLLAAFAGFALLLAVIGLYSVLAYGVRQRIREIGIRIALGAGTRGVVRMVIGDALAPDPHRDRRGAPGGGDLAARRRKPAVRREPG